MLGLMLTFIGVRISGYGHSGHRPDRSATDLFLISHLGAIKHRPDTLRYLSSESATEIVTLVTGWLENKQGDSSEPHCPVIILVFIGESAFCRFSLSRSGFVVPIHLSCDIFPAVFYVEMIGDRVLDLSPQHVIYHILVVTLIHGAILNSGEIHLDEVREIVPAPCLAV